MINKWAFKLKRNGEPWYRCFCRNPELIENYNLAIADTTQTWLCHHRLETHTSDGERRLVDITEEELIALGIYYDRPANELIFLTRAEHSALHNKDRKHTEEWKENNGKMMKEQYASGRRKATVDPSIGGKANAKRAKQIKEKIRSEGLLCADDIKKKDRPKHKIAYKVGQIIAYYPL